MKNEIIGLHEESKFLRNKYASRQTLAFGASRAIRAAAAFPALFSSIKLMVELIISKAKMPTKSW